MRKLFFIVICLYFGQPVFAQKHQECPCCQPIESCMLTPEASTVDIKIDFEHMDPELSLYALEACSKEGAFEINKKNPLINGKINKGRLTLVLCKKTAALDTVELNIDDEYTDICKITKSILCKKNTHPCVP